MPAARLDHPAVSVVIPTFNGLRHLRRCLPNVAAECAALDEPAEILVVDNGSSDGSEQYIRSTFPSVRILSLGANRGFAAACDAGIRATTGDYALLLNNDAWFEAGALGRLLRAARAGDYAVAGPMILNPDGSLQWGPQVIDFLGDPVSAAAGQSPFLLVGAALLIRRRDYLELGGLDGRYFAFYEESDFQWRAQLAGRTIGYAPQARIFHLGGGTLGGAIVRPGGAAVIQRDRLYWARRNQLASLLKNYSLASLLVVLPLWLLSAAAECAAASALGHRAVPRLYLMALVWNVRHLPGTLRRRRAVQAARLRSDGELRRGFAPPFARLRTLIELARHRTRLEIA